MKVGTAGTEQTFLKMLQELARRQDEAAALQILSCILFCNLLTQTRYGKKEISR